MLAEIELPRVLPVNQLSLSSINLLRRCPERWRRRYIEREYERPSGSMLVGSAAGAAEATNFQLKVTSGVDLDTSDLLDAYADEWHERTDRDDIDWGADDPDHVRASGQAALTVYHQAIAPLVQPVSVEREFRLRFADCDWSFTGFIDVEEADGHVDDLKVKGKKLSQSDADSDPQPTAYLLARREEARAGHGEPAAGFRFHTMIRTKSPQALVVPTERTDAQLDAYLHRIYSAAAEIAWRAEYDVWDGAAPGGWWCSEKMCGYWASCPLGGAR